MNVREKAEDLGGRIIPAPNAMYACDFKDIATINLFIKWLDGNGFTHGDILESRTGFDVRYEK